MKIEKIAILAKLEDGSIRQIVIRDNQKDIILEIISLTEKDKSIKILETELLGIEF